MAVIPNRWLIDIAVVAGALAAIYGYGVYQHREGFKAGAKSVQDAWNAEKLAAQTVAIKADAKHRNDEHSAAEAQTKDAHDAQVQQTVIVNTNAAAGAAAIERLRNIPKSAGASCRAVPASASATAGLVSEPAAARLSDADIRDLVAVGVSANEVSQGLLLQLRQCGASLNRAYRMTN